MSAHSPFYGSLEEESKHIIFLAEQFKVKLIFLKNLIRKQNGCKIVEIKPGNIILTQKIFHFLNEEASIIF
jgi:hypothetical protein